MAQANPPLSSARRFVAGRPGAAISGQNDISRKLHQLHSLLSGQFAVDGDWLGEMTPTHRENIMWLATDLVVSIQESFSQMLEANHG